MRKGPAPEKAIDIALPIALARGIVVFCRRDRNSGIDLVAACPGLTALVCICRTRTLGAPVDALGAQLRLVIAALRRVPRSHGRYCEIWACDYYGNIRLFRLTETGLEEIGRDGNPLSGEPGSSSGEVPMEDPSPAVEGILPDPSVGEEHPGGSG